MHKEEMMVIMPPQCMCRAEATKVTFPWQHQPSGFQVPVAQIDRDEQIDRDDSNYAVAVILASHHGSYHYSSETMHTQSGGYDGDVSTAALASFCHGITDHSTEVMHAEIRGQHGNNATAGQLALS